MNDIIQQIRQGHLPKDERLHKYVLDYIQPSEIEPPYKVNITTLYLRCILSL